MKKYIVGVIGAGRIGLLHLNNLKKLPHVSVKAVSDPYIDQIEIESADTMMLKSHQGIMDDPEIDAVFICSPTPFHVPLIIEAAKAGKHIFCEKPISLDLETTEKCLQEVKSCGVKLQIGFNRRFDPNFAKIRKVLSEGKIGDPHVLRITSRDPSPPPIEYVKISGGIFLDMMIHDFDMARFLIGSEVKEVFAAGANRIDPQIGECGDVDTAIVTLKFENDVLGVIDNSRQAVYGYDQRVEVFGASGSIATENKLPTQTVLSTETGVITEKPLYFFLERYQDAYVQEANAFFDYLSQDVPSPVAGNDGLAALKIALAALKSLKKNQPVQV
ncbi:MAG: inositol 2-dehydrogenase [SAR324 cluster bacterium]|nr:inositol 2-dehydrogenase [SAR324 cluster bacterium]